MNEVEKQARAIEAYQKGDAVLVTQCPQRERGEVGRKVAVRRGFLQRVLVFARRD